MNFLPFYRMNAGLHRRHWLLGLCVAAGCATISTSALAAPELAPTGSDPIMRLLEEHNLVGTHSPTGPERGEASLLTQVRDTT
ncbi:MAG: hypothetical protein KA185_12225, partial [Vitreoscilla sp.]|nr:hypothetical protein [Vitreoscilla sp.]